ncbi:phosphoglucosamine mutase [Plasticicumulans acidivorans]|uniref:Phosphoglucosamine mutase n=2 Tax=Plasticicumulans acidivorans TaxID=886464 RepID=A0A317MR34_9GAMM|nr:phosphoglucosamine mutase [Plasticicumulans acidivorans]
MQKRFFGTDGIRGRVGESPITPEFMLKLGWAAGRVLARAGNSKVLIGKDTRISGYMFESALEAGLSAAGINISLLGPMPTPAVAYLTRTLHADAGIVISASHNPYWDNGVKFFSRDGRKLPDDVELDIERAIDELLVTVEPGVLGKAERVVDAAGRYIEFCKSTVPMAIDLSGIKMVVDCANGATYHIASNVFSELGASVSVLAVNPDGLNINVDCGSTKPRRLQDAVLMQGADLGVAFDGDGDRVVFVDCKGNVVDGDELLFIIARDRLKHGELPGSAVVGTQMSNFGLELALGNLGIALHRAKVGDRYVMEALAANGLTVGGEGSGHLICLDRTTTGDGIVSALQVLAAMVMDGCGLHDLAAGMRKLPQVMVNVPISGLKDWMTCKPVLASVRSAERRLASTGRVLLRPSGTEPVVRVMVEGEDSVLVNQLAHEIAEVVAQQVA